MTIFNQAIRSIARAVLTAAFALCMFSAACCPASAESVTHDITIEGMRDYDKARSVFEIVNQERKASDPSLSELALDKELTDAAMKRAEEIAVYYSHTRPDLSKFSTAAAGYNTVGENIAYGYTDAEDVMKGWMDSEGHRENILRSAYSSIGIGCFTHEGYTFWVQIFGVASGEATESTYTGTVDTAPAITADESVISPRMLMEDDGFAQRYLVDAKSELEAGETLQLIAGLDNMGTGWTYAIIKEDAVAWSSSDPEVASVSESGLVTAHQTGTAAITAKAGTVTVLHEISVKPSIEDADISGISESYVYTGTFPEIDPVVKYNGKTLEKDVDYTVENPDWEIEPFDDPDTAIEVYITITGINDFTGFVEKYFYLVAPEEEPSEESDEPSDEPTDGETGGNAGGEGTGGTGDENPEQGPADISSFLDAVKTGTCYYSGEEQRPVYVEGLAENTDYYVEYYDNIEAGTATAYIHGMGGYEGCIGPVTFTINKASISEKTATLSAASYAYNGSERKPDVDIPGLKEGSDFTVSYENNTYPGTGTATITGIGSYTGTIVKNFTIKAPSVAAPESVSVRLEKGDYDAVYASWSAVKATGAAVKYKVQYRYGSGSWKTATSGTTDTSHTVKALADGKKVSIKVTPYVVINSKTYSGGAKTSAEVYTLKKLNKPTVKKAGSAKVKVNWNNINGESGYEVYRSAKKTKGFKLAKRVNSAKAKSATFKAAKKKTYYYKVRAFKTIKISGKAYKVYGPWSAVKPYKLK